MLGIVERPCDGPYPARGSVGGDGPGGRYACWEKRHVIIWAISPPEIRAIRPPGKKAKVISRQITWMLIGFDR
jgi:hypothetical protein